MVITCMFLTFALFLVFEHFFQKRFDEKQQELTETIKSNTDKIELLMVLKREKAEVERLVAQQPKRKEKIEKISEAIQSYKKEIARLEDIVRNQQRQLEVVTGLSVSSMLTQVNVAATQTRNQTTQYQRPVTERYSRKT